MDNAKKNSPFWYVEGNWTTSDDKENVMIGKEIANTLGLSVGDKFKVTGVKYGAVASTVEDSAEKSKEKDSTDDFARQRLL